MIRKLLSNKAALLGIVVLVLVLIAATCSPLVSPYKPNQQQLRNNLQPPSSEHWAGTDKFGRDVLSRLIYGSRASLLVGALSVVVGLVIGVPLGLLAGYRGGAVDSLISRLLDVMLAFPATVLSIVVVAMVGTDLASLALAIGLALSPKFARVVRGETLLLKEQEHVLAARALGVSNFRILRVHILPHALPSMTVQATFSLVNAIMAEAALSFLGLGVQPPTPAWGNMVRDGLSFMTTAWWLPVFPGLCILVTVLAVNLIGDALRDATDPVLRHNV